MTSDVQRILPTDEAHDLLALVREVAREELAPQVEAAEAASEFPAEAYALLGKSGLMSLPFEERWGGGAQPYEVYLQVIEELATVWPSVAVGTSVHALTATVLDKNATEEQREAWLPRMLSGDWLGAYCLSEAQAGSDVSGIRTKAVREGGAAAGEDDGEYVVTGTKQWISNGPHADYYVLFARTSDDGRSGLSSFLVPADSPGISHGAPEKKMGLHCDPTSTVSFDGTRVPAAQRISEEGRGMAVALSALDAGRLGISAVATGIAQAALSLATSYAREREQFGQRIGDFQGMQFLLADMAAAVGAARATYLHAARLKDAGKPFGPEASIAKLTATDAAMKVTTDAVQVLGGAGYTADFPAERLFRDAKVTQIFEGTNQIQRMVIGRSLLK